MVKQIFCLYFFADNFVMDRFHQDLMLETQDSDSDDDSADLIEREFREGSNLEDIYFQDLSPGNIY